jgi:hypothetical protein
LKTVLVNLLPPMNDIRMPLSDKSIAQLPTPKDGWYLARDTELKGFFVVVGKRKRTFTVQGDLRQGGKRASSIRVSIGDTRVDDPSSARDREGVSGSDQQRTASEDGEARWRLWLRPG